MSLDLGGKVIVISGGTSGLGREMVLRCTEHGANVVFGGRNRNKAERILSQAEKNSGKVAFVRTDVANPADCKKLFDEADTAFGRIDGFINYAGITSVAPLDSCQVDLLDSVMNVNFRAAFLCCQHAINYMRLSGGGSIVLIGSPHAWGGDRDRAAYACSKGALITLMRHIAKNYACENIRCNYLTMGWTLTDGEIALRESQVDDVDKYFEEAAKLIPMKRLCMPEDYAEQVLYLLSDDSAMMTGSILQMSAGYFL